MPIGPYRGMSDREARAVVAHLRTVKPIKRAVPKSLYNIPLPPSYGPPVGQVPDTPRSDKVVLKAGPMAPPTRLAHTGSILISR